MPGGMKEVLIHQPPLETKQQVDERDVEGCQELTSATSDGSVQRQWTLIGSSLCFQALEETPAVIVAKANTKMDISEVFESSRRF